MCVKRVNTFVLWRGVSDTSEGQRAYAVRVRLGRIEHRPTNRAQMGEGGHREWKKKKEKETYARGKRDGNV